MEYLSAKSGGERRRVARVLHTPELPFCNDAIPMSRNLYTQLSWTRQKHHIEKGDMLKSRRYRNRRLGDFL